MTHKRHRNPTKKSFSNKTAEMSCKVKMNAVLFISRHCISWHAFFVGISTFLFARDKDDGSQTVVEGRDSAAPRFDLADECLC